MSRLQSHPFEPEVDKMLSSLNVDLKVAKQIFETGTMYHFTFINTPAYISLPTFIPTCHDNLIRLEFTIGTVEANEVGRLLFAVALDFDMHRYHPLRIVPRTKNKKEYEVLLQTVCPADLVKNDFIAATVLYGVELAEFYRQEFLNQNTVA